MKKIKHFAFFVIIILTNFLVSNCSKGSDDSENSIKDSIENVSGNLNGKLNEKDAAIQELVSSFNEIQENLNAIKEKEKIISKVTSDGDVKSKEDQIKEDIQSIYDLMAKNKDRIGSLSKKLKNSKLKIEGLEKMIENMQATLNLKDSEIEELKTKIEGLNVELSNLTTNYKAVENESNQKTEIINTAFYAIGTSKELKEKNVITKEGGIIGLGKTTKLSSDFNKEYFTKINIEKTTSINLGAKKIKILTTHPSNSYKLIGEKPIEKLEITNTKEFWSASKYLVIILD
jgi:DNA repair exonuclease SbcCD ATPase subunit